jgi:N-acetylmuramoyl-L-alanine amidase
MISEKQIANEQRTMSTLMTQSKLVGLNGFDFQLIKYQGPTSHFFFEKTKKHRIVLHYTAGQFMGDLPTLTGKSGKVSTAYLIPRNGSIIELHNPDYWSYHMGPGAIGGNKEMSMSSIGIELTNYGWLNKEGKEMRTWAKVGRNVYCMEDNTDLYIKKSFRGKDYWCTFTDAQYNSLAGLLKYLSIRFDIPLKTLRPESRLETNEKAASFLTEHKGVFTHSNYRKDKWDIGPAFQWDRVL